jgi:hypothetical protein
MNKDYGGPNLELIAARHPEWLDLAEKFHTDGYVIFDLDISDEFNIKIIQDVQKILRDNCFKTNPSIYHYNESPRIVEAWKMSKHIKSLALHTDILEILSALYDAKPLPFSTINFIKGTEQPFHSDYVHFGSRPELYLAGVWVALEDISEDCGPLAIVKGSHKTPIMDFQDLGFDDPPTTTKKVKEYYSAYEARLSRYIEEQNLEIVTPLLRAGQALIWAANLFHGAGKINNAALTRYSQVTHYHFANCGKFYNPNFSDRKKLQFASRDVLSNLIQ